MGKPTFAQEILLRYKALQEELSVKMGGGDDDEKSKPSFFPQLGEIDSLDIAVLIVTYFSRSYGGDYRPILKNIALFRGIDIPDDTMDKVYPSIKAFIDWLIETVRAKDEKDSKK